MDFLQGRSLFAGFFLCQKNFYIKEKNNMTAKTYLEETLRRRQELLKEMDRMAELLRRALGVANGEQERLQELQGRILRLVLTVPDPMERRVLFHRCYCGMSWRQIAEKLDISEGAARRRHQAALKHLALPDGQ